MDDFVSSIKDLYKERLVQIGEQWPPVRGDKLINLQLVEIDKTKEVRRDVLRDDVMCTRILYTNLFQIDGNRKPIRKIIVEGSAGMGKTTLCTLLAEEWAEGKILTRFDCVLLLPLRDKRVSSTTSLLEVFEHLHPEEDICKNVVTTIKRRAGKGILIIADGWDELNDDKHSKHSFLYNILFGGLLPFVSVLLTSRPSASALLHNLKCVHQLIEVVGFSKKNIEQYIQAEFIDLSADEKSFLLIEELENNPLIQSVCAVPLNCAIVCHLWRTLNQSLPTTLTELYTQIVLNVIYRDISKNVPDCNFGLSLTNFDCIPQHLQESFWLTCKFAFECLCRNQIVFSEDELTSVFPEFLSSGIKFLCFGLLQSARSLLPVGYSLSFHFAHLTIQEFLAALHLATLSNEIKLEEFEIHMKKSDRFDIVLRFMFGLGTPNYKCSSKIVCFDNESVHQILSSISVVDFIRLCHFALESFSGSLTTEEDDIAFTITKEVSSAVRGRFYAFGGTPHDVTAVLHVLRHTEFSSTRINLPRCGMSDKQLTELTSILSGASASDLQVVELDLSNNCLSNGRVVRLLEMVSPVLVSLGNLFLKDCCITNIPPQILSKRANTIAHLSLSDNPLGVLGVQSLQIAVEAGAIGRLRFLYLCNTLTDDADINGALLTTLLPSLASHCPQLRWLNLSKNVLGVPGACAVGRAINFFHSFSFVLHDICIDLDAMVSFCSCVTASQKLRTSPEAFVSVSFSDNAFGFGSFPSIFFLFNRYLQIKSLANVTTVSNTAHNPYPRPRLTDLLNLCPIARSCNVTKLDLSHNNFSGPQIIILAGCIRVCLLLKTLYCNDCFLTATDLFELLHSLKSSGIIHVCLKQFELYDNFIDNEGANQLIDNLHHISEVFPVLADLNVTGDMMDPEIKIKLNGSWEAHKIDVPRLIIINSDASIEQVLIESKRCAILSEFNRTKSFPQTEELLLEFQRMWDELLWELCYMVYVMDLCPHLFGLPINDNRQSAISNDVVEKLFGTSSSDDESFHSATEELEAGSLTTDEILTTLPTEQPHARAKEKELPKLKDVALTPRYEDQIFSVLKKARDKYYFVGKEIGLDDSDLKEIDMKFHPDTLRCLNEVLKRRIQKGGLTRFMLCKALKSENVQRDDVAQEIEALSFH